MGTRADEGKKLELSSTQRIEMRASGRKNRTLQTKPNEVTDSKKKKL